MADNKKPTREEAEAAVRTMLAWTGDNPDREGLVETPKRVVRAYEQFFSGYEMKFFQKFLKKLRVMMKW
jgi:GTP cyclohydrolase I